MPFAEATTPEAPPPEQAAAAVLPTEVAPAEVPAVTAAREPAEALPLPPPPAPEPPPSAVAPQQTVPTFAPARPARAATQRPQAPRAQSATGRGASPAQGGATGAAPPGEASAAAASGGAAGTLEAARLPPDYAAAIARILRRNLRYPAIARDQGIEGVVVVTFAIARDGTVLAPSLLRSSGAAMLDQEALALLRRVSPLPRLPESMPGAQANVVVPIGFELR
jgi:protein TonB